MEHPDRHVPAVEVLGVPFELPCGVVLKNRLVKAAMSDSLGDGAGNPTSEQVALYRRWAHGGAAVSLIGEVQIDHRYPEKPGNLVLGESADNVLLAELAAAGSENGSQIWPQLGHAGALADARVSRPAGPSLIDIDGLRCEELTVAEIEALPLAYSKGARQARDCGFGGVQIHAGHGFLLSQFLSSLFNRRSDSYGGSVEGRCRLLVDIISEVRREVGPGFPIAVRINSSDQLEGGLSEDDSLAAISLLDRTTVDLIDISGGTYFPGAPASSDRRSTGPYFVEFARRARAVTTKPLMVTGGFKTSAEAIKTLETGAADFVGLARTMALDPDLATNWLETTASNPQFPTFESPPEGGITAWYTMRLSAIAAGNEQDFDVTLDQAIDMYESRDESRAKVWNETFGTL